MVSSTSLQEQLVVYNILDMTKILDIIYHISIYIFSPIFPINLHTIWTVIVKQKTTTAMYSTKLFCWKSR